MSPDGIQPWRPSASSMLFHEPTWSMILTFVPSWRMNRSFDASVEGELFTDETGRITIAPSAFM